MHHCCTDSAPGCASSCGTVVARGPNNFPGADRRAACACLSTRPASHAPSAHPACEGAAPCRHPGAYIIWGGGGSAPRCGQLLLQGSVRPSSCVFQLLFLPAPLMSLPLYVCAQQSGGSAMRQRGSASRPAPRTRAERLGRTPHDSHAPLACPAAGPQRCRRQAGCAARPRAPPAAAGVGCGGVDAAATPARRQPPQTPPRHLEALPAACWHPALHARQLRPPPPTFLPRDTGTYLYLIMCLIWRFMVTPNSRSQYMSRMGQKTGTSNTLNSVIPSPISKDLKDDHLARSGRREGGGGGGGGQRGGAGQGTPGGCWWASRRQLRWRLHGRRCAVRRAPRLPRAAPGRRSGGPRGGRC